MDVYGNVNEIVVPMNEGELSEELKEFIEREPGFIPEIYSQKFENILIQNNTLGSTIEREKLLTHNTLLQIENF